MGEREADRGEAWGRGLPRSERTMANRKLVEAGGGKKPSRFDKHLRRLKMEVTCAAEGLYRHFDESPAKSSIARPDI